MPATRPHLDRHVKRKQILDAAEALLLRDGYDRTAMAEVARCAGVANNAVYWYFPGKDDLLAAVLQRRLRSALDSLAVEESSTPDEQVVAMLSQLDQVAKLTAAVHERARHSVAVADVHEAFHAAADELLRNLFRAAGLDVDAAGKAAMAMVALIEGIHLHEVDRDAVARDELVLWMLDRLVPS